jgi:hypothetical protein
MGQKMSEQCWQSLKWQVAPLMLNLLLKLAQSFLFTIKLETSWYVLCWMLCSIVLGLNSSQYYDFFFFAILALTFILQ